MIDLDMNEIFNNPAILDVILERIVDEVIKRLKNQPKTALVCFSGALIGFQTALDNIARLKQEKGWQFKVYFSDNAFGAIDPNKVKEALGVDKIHCTETQTPQRELWEEVDGVIIATATINTVAKLAVGICDNEMLTLINHAIMAGKPVVCAADGACPDNEVRAKIGMGKSPEGYRQMLRGNLAALTSFGIDVIAAEDLFDICLDTPAGEEPKVAPVASKKVAPASSKKAALAPASYAVPKAVAPVTRIALSAAPAVTSVKNDHVLDPDPFKDDPILTKRIISRLDICKARPNKVVKVSANSIVTDYAKEAAKEFGMVIEIV